jgi:glutathione S-transferase
MLDSPFVRRVAISLELLNIPFEHIALSVFKNYNEFKNINPVVKAPSLVCDNGVVFSESSLILQYIETEYQCRDQLWPRDTPDAFPRDMHAVSLGLVACEKCAQFIYERNLRPAAYQYEPWLTRVKEQLESALTGLETEIQQRPAAFDVAARQATITTAISWQFVHAFMPEVTDPVKFPLLAALSANMESTPIYQKHPPVGPGVRAN